MTMAASNSRKTSPPISSGISRMKNSMLLGVAGLTMTYNVFHSLLQDSPFAIPAEEYCPEENPTCFRPDLFAFQLTCFVALLYLGWNGFLSWHVTKRLHKQLNGSPQDRVFGYWAEGEKLAAVNLTFQAWNLVASLLIEEHCTLIMLSHHTVAALVSWSSLDSQYMHYYGVYFLGLSELSSVFLVFLDLAKFFPPSPGSLADQWVGICGPCFAVSFFIYRVILWWKVLLNLWSDTMFVLRKGLAERMRPGKTYVLYLFMAVSIPMGMLQLYWFHIIVTEVVKVLIGE